MIPVKIGKKTYEVRSVPQAIQLILAHSDEVELYRQHDEGD